MSSSASIMQEFYKVREEWARADKLKGWRLAVWVAQFQDVDIIDKFLETERSPVGVFDDMFFRFDTEYKGDTEAFEKALWQEYAGWFAAPPQEKYDMVKALKNDGWLDIDFAPQLQPETGFEGLMKELLRFKSCIKDLDKVNFCLYFPPVRPEAYMLGAWLVQQLKKGIPNGIRLVTIDFAENRKIDIHPQHLQPLVVEITPRLNMQEAINNEMDRGGGNHNTVGPDERFRRQIRVVMNTTPKENAALTGKEVQTMLSLSRQINTPSVIISALLVAAQAHFSIKDHAQCERYADEALVKAEAAMKEEEPAGYPTWKAAAMLKGALLATKRKWHESIAVYDRMAEEATKRGDAFFIMEGHRLSGHMQYQQGKLNIAFEKLLLALVGGSYLEKQVIRQSTFLHAAGLAIAIGEKIRDHKDLEVLKAQLADWIGDDWEALLEEANVEDAAAKQKKGFTTLSDS